MDISKEEVLHVAKLAKLSFKEQDLSDMTNQLGKIIEMFDALGDLDTADVPVTTHVGDLINVMREDIAVDHDEREALLENAPETQDGFIKVPAMLDNGEAGA